MSHTLSPDQIKRLTGNGSKAVQCIRCEAEIQPYAGRGVALISGKYAHHPGQCADADDRRRLVRKLAADEGTLFAWRCDHVEPGSTTPDVCDVVGTDRGEYEAHAREHGCTALKPTVAPVRLRCGMPGHVRQAPRVPAFKRIEWTQHHFAEWKPGVGNEQLPDTHHRGQFWANGPDAHSVIVIEDRRADGLPNRLVTLYLNSGGQLTADWSDASVSRREANRRARDRKLYAAQ